MNSFELAGTLVGSIFGSQVLVSIAQGWFNRNKTKADAETDIAATTIEYTKLLTARIDILEKKIDNLTKEHLQCQVNITEIRTELRLYKEGLIKGPTSTPTPVQTTDPVVP